MRKSQQRHNAAYDSGFCALRSGLQPPAARAHLAEAAERAARQHALVRVQVRPAQPAARRRGACSRRRVSASVPPRHRLKQPKRSSAARGMGRTWRACCRAAAPPATRRSRGSGSAGHRRHRRFARPLQVSTPALAPPPPRRKTGRTRPAARHPPRACRRAAPPPGARAGGTRFCRVTTHALPRRPNKVTPRARRARGHAPGGPRSRNSPPPPSAVRTSTVAASARGPSCARAGAWRRCSETTPASRPRSDARAHASAAARRGGAYGEGARPARA